MFSITILLLLKIYLKGHSLNIYYVALLVGPPLFSNISLPKPIKYNKALISIGLNISKAILNRNLILKGG